MIDINKACEMATAYRNEPYISDIIDIGHSFVISTLSSEGESADVSPCMVNKQTGTVDICFFPDYFEEITKGKDVSIPKKYQFIKS